MSQTFTYLAPSRFSSSGLFLQTSGGPAANPRFFRGFLTTPRPAAAALPAVAEVARTRYYQPRNPAGLDPLHLSVGPDDLTVSTMDGPCKHALAVSMVAA